METTWEQPEQHIFCQHQMTSSSFLLFYEKLAEIRVLKNVPNRVHSLKYCGWEQLLFNNPPSPATTASPPSPVSVEQFEALVDISSLLAELEQQIPCTLMVNSTWLDLA